MKRDSALDELAFMVSLHLMSPDEQRRLRIELLRQVRAQGELVPELERLEHEDQLIRGECPPKSHYDNLVIAKAAAEARAPRFDEAFWSRRRSDLLRAGFTKDEAWNILKSLREAINDPIPEAEGANHDVRESAA